MNELTLILQQLAEYAVRHRVPIIGPDSAKLLTAAAAKRQPQSVLEIGTAIGYSTLLMASVLPPNAQITTIEIDELRLNIARESFARAGMSDRINSIAGDASLILPDLSEKYDFVFIDAAKGQYLNYLQSILAKLTANSVVFADNVLFRGMVKNQVATPRRYRTLVRRLQAYLDFVTYDKRFMTTIYKTGDGVAISYYQGE